MRWSDEHLAWIYSGPKTLGSQQSEHRQSSDQKAFDRGLA